MCSTFLSVDEPIPFDQLFLSEEISFWLLLVNDMKIVSPNHYSYNDTELTVSGLSEYFFLFLSSRDTEV